MSLDRKDIRGKLEPHWHKRFKKWADRESLCESELLEKIVMKALKKRLHKYTLYQAEFDDMPQPGKNRDDQGRSG